jgi:hypothetical protein
MRSPTTLELAAIIAVGGSVLAVGIPTFLRNLQASHLSEAVRGLNEIGAGAMQYADGKIPAEAFPPSAPLTPTQVPRGARAVDSAGTWDHMTWAALGFRQTSDATERAESAHYFSFAFDSANGPTRAVFIARAHGDLDGDGDRSTFEIQGECTETGARILPGMLVEREVE